MKHLVLLGPGKAGSSWLYSVLCQSKNFCCPQVKETYFFNKNYNLGNAWYMNKFSLDKSTLGFGDFSNQNYRYVETVQNALRNFPDTIFIYLKRETSQRIESAYKFEKMNGSKLTPQEFFSSWEDAWFSNKSMIKEFQRLIPKAQLHIINFSDIQNAPESVLMNLSEVIGFNVCLPEKVEKNVSLKPRLRFLARAGKKISLFLRLLGFLKALQSIKSNSFIRKFFYTVNVVKLSADEKVQIMTIVEDRKLLLRLLDERKLEK
jgi:hypothetical protein